MAQQFDIDGPSALSVTFYAGFNGLQMVELTARQAYVSATATTGAVFDRFQFRITLEEFLAVLNHAEIREAAEKRR